MIDHFVRIGRVRGRPKGAFGVAIAAVMVLTGLITTTPASAQTTGYGSGSWTAIDGGYGSPPLTTQHGGCLFLSANPGLGAPSIPLGSGLSGWPAMATYGSIDWNSQLNGSGTPCANKSFKIQGGDFEIAQWLYVWNWYSGQWEVCNQGPGIWNPGPTSHAVTTQFGWPQPPPCWDHAVLYQGAVQNLYQQRSSIADKFGFGYGQWDLSNSYIDIWQCQPGQQFC